MGFTIMKYVTGSPLYGDDREHNRKVLHLFCDSESGAAVKTTLVESMLSEALRGSRQRLIGYTKIMLFHLSFGG